MTSRPISKTSTTSPRAHPTTTIRAETAGRAHPRVAAAIFLFVGGVLALGALTGPLLLPSAVRNLTAQATDEARIADALLDASGRTAIVLAACFALPCLVAGAGLLSRRGWSRWIGIPLAAVALVFFPVGTLVGAYLLWILLAERFEPWFERAGS